MPHGPTDLQPVVGSAPRADAPRRGALLSGLSPALIYLGTRSVGLIIVFELARAHSKSLLEVLTSWDAAWLLAIARHGYSGVSPDHLDSFGHHTETTALAFFPGYPYLVRALSVTGLPPLAAAFTVSLIAGVACAYGLVRLATVVGLSRRAGLVLVVLFAAAPLSIVLTMPYTEALFCALAVWTLVAVLTKRWILAATLCILAGLVRPTGLVLAAVVCASALHHVLTERKAGREWFALLSAPLGIAGYLGYIAVRTGRWDGWLQLQQTGWGYSFDFGHATLRDAAAILAYSSDAMLIISVAVICGYAALAAVTIKDRLSWPVVAYGIGAMLMAVQSSVIMNSKARLLLVAFPLLLPAAARLARHRTPTVIIITSAYALASGWFSAYSLTVWKYAI